MVIEIVILTILCLFLLTPVVGAILSVTFFTLTLIEGDYYWKIVSLGSTWAIIVIIIVLIAYALIYTMIAIKIKYYALLLQAMCYILLLIVLISIL